MRSWFSPAKARRSPRMQPIGRQTATVRRTRGFAALASVMLAFLLSQAEAAKANRGGDLIGRMGEHTTVYSDTLLDLARDHKLGLIELMAANPGVDPWLPGEGKKLTLPTAHLLPDAPRNGIVINTAELRMYYFGDPAKPVSFPLGVGREGYLTPLGATTVARKAEKPSWYLTPSERRDNPDLPAVIPPGEDNPLGEHALYLGWPTYLIHGTNIPWGVGRRASRGCIRMYPEDIAWLYPKIAIGTPVMVVDQPVKLGWSGGQLYLEVHPSVQQVDIMEETSRAPAPPEPIALAEQSDRILLAAGEDADRLDWTRIKQVLAERPGYPVQITQGPPRTEPVAGKAAPPTANRETSLASAAANPTIPAAQPAKPKAVVQPASATKPAATAASGGSGTVTTAFQPRPVAAPRR